MVGHIGVGAADDILQLVARPCHDQIFQVNGTVVFFRFVHHIQGRDIVVFARLLDQLAHGLPDGQILADADVVGGHAAADLVLIVGHQQPDIFRRILIQMFDQLLLVVLFQIFQCVHRIVRVHAGNDLCRFIRRQFLQIRLGIVQIGEDLCHTIHTQDRIELLPFVRRQLFQRIGQIIFVVIRQLFGDLVCGQTAVDDAEYFFQIIFLLHGIQPPIRSGLAR